METELDHDDALGRRFRALGAWDAPRPTDEAWQGAASRRRRRRARRYAAAGLAVVVIVGATTAAIVARDPSPTRVTVVAPTDPPVVSVLPPAPTGANISVSPAGPYGRGDRAYVVATVTATASFRFDDPNNTDVELCFRYGSGELCDPTPRTHYVSEHGVGGPFPYEVWLPGWVHTPAGLRPCDEVGCRLEFQSDDGTRIGTPPLAIEAGPKPVEPAHITGIHRDEALIQVHIDRLEPDPSWHPNSLPAGSMAVCAFAEHLLCDSLVRPDPPPFDGQPHDIVVSTNRQLLTAHGWVDCVQYVCALVISRSTHVVIAPNTASSDSETVAVLPYQLPDTTPEMVRPTLTRDRIGPMHVGDTVAVLLEHAPANVDIGRLQLAMCWGNDLQKQLDCNFPDTRAWTVRPDGVAYKVFKVTECPSTDGCYYAIAPVVKGQPEVARTEGRFQVTP